MDESAPPPARRQGLLLLGVVFVLGLVCGAALLFLGHRMIMRGGFRGVGPWGGRDRMGLERLSGELSLDSDQKKKIEAIMSAHRDQIHRLLEESRSEIRALLRPEQQTIFDRLGPRHPGWHGGVPGLPPGPPEPPSPAPEPPR